MIKLLDHINKEIKEVKESKQAILSLPLSFKNTYETGVINGKMQILSELKTLINELGREEYKSPR